MNLTQEQIDIKIKKHGAWLLEERPLLLHKYQKGSLQQLSKGFEPERADLTDADLTDADLTDAVLTGADLTRAVLRGADLTDADLRGAGLTDAVLTGAVLRGADLRGTGLTDAVLTRADLTRAVLRGAVLTRADLTRAVLRGADLTDAVLTDAKGIFVMPVAEPRQWGRCIAVRHSDHWMIKAGCRWFNVENAKAHWGDSYDGDRSIGDSYLYGIEWLEKQPIPQPDEDGKEVMTGERSTIAASV